MYTSGDESLSASVRATDARHTRQEASKPEPSATISEPQQSNSSDLKHRNLRMQISAENLSQHVRAPGRAASHSHSRFTTRTHNACRHTDKSCLQPITGPIVIEGYTGVGMDVVGAGCEDRRKYQWWTLGEQPYDNVWHTSHTH